MQLIKFILLFSVFFICMLVGRLISKKYRNRVEELKQMQNALNMVKTKMRFTYEPLPDIFEEVQEKVTNFNIASIFQKAGSNMKEKTAGQAWRETLEEQETNFTKEDHEIIKNFSRLLGKTDLEGQLSEIELVVELLEVQRRKAEESRNKNEKMYQTLGMVAGLAIVIILI